MAEIASGGIGGLFASTSINETFYLTPEGYLATSSGTPTSSTVFNQDIAALHRSASSIILPDGWISWVPNLDNNEWDEYSIGTPANYGTASLVDGSGVDLPSVDPGELFQDDYNNDTVHYAFDPTSAAWQNLAYGDTLTVTFTVSAIERGLFGNVVDTDTMTVTLKFIQVCFARGTMIETDYGPVAIEDIRPGTLVRTIDNGLQPVRWIGSSVVGGSSRRIPDRLKPIRIKAGALGNGTPSADLLVSPQHRVLVKSRIVQKMFSTDEVLIAAKQLLQIDGVDVDNTVERVEYFHVMFDQHQIILSNGALTESLYLGSEALKGLGGEAVAEILEILPQLREVLEDRAVWGGARPLVSGRLGRKAAIRHQQNGVALVN